MLREGGSRDADPVGVWGLAGHPGRGLAAVDQPGAINWRTVGVALVTLVGFAFAVLRWSFGRAVLEALTDGVNAVINSSNTGIQFLFGPLIPDPKEGVVFALQVLPVIIFFASLMSVLYYLKVMQVVIRVLGGGSAWPPWPGRSWSATPCSGSRSTTCWPPPS
jgi:concentrative nucleoside transporter, CNT family